MRLLLAFGLLFYSIVLIPSCQQHAGKEPFEEITHSGENKEENKTLFLVFAGGGLLTAAGSFCLLTGKFHGFFEDHDGTQRIVENTRTRLGRMMFMAGILGLTIGLILLLNQ